MALPDLFWVDVFFVSYFAVAACALGFGVYVLIASRQALRRLQKKKGMSHEKSGTDHL